jgi:hypothetical protein
MSLTDAMTKIVALKRERPGIDARPPSGSQEDLQPPPAPETEDGEPSPDVFISYAMPDDEALAAALEAALAAKGYKVWRATGIVGGETPHRVIGKALTAARAVVVLWTPASIDLDWVYSEAKRAKKSGKLIPLRTTDVDPDDIPPPFDTVQTLSYDDLPNLIVALRRLGIDPDAVSRSA